jgi:uridine phosphorylase
LVTIVAMSYPNVLGKWDHPSVTGPGDFLEAARAAGWDPGALPTAVLFTYSPVVTRFLAENPDRFTENPKLAPSNARFFVTADTAPLIGISCLGTGAGAVGTQIQNLIYLGVRKFASIGTAGGLVESLEPGQIVLVTSAVRDDGVSQHFLPPARYIEPDELLTDRLRQALAVRLARAVEGRTWTVAVPYRMTAQEIREYTSEGVITTEMEAAAVFAIARAQRAESASAVVVTDVTTPAGRVREDWRASNPGLLQVVDAALDALCR